MPKTHALLGAEVAALRAGDKPPPECGVYMPFTRDIPHCIVEVNVKKKM